MKKFLVLTLILLSAFFLLGCDFFNQTTITKAETPVTTVSSTVNTTTAAPTTAATTTAAPTTAAPTTAAPTTAAPTTAAPTTAAPTTAAPTTEMPVTTTVQTTAVEYAITFEENGGSAVTNITSIAGVAITKPTDPTKEGYTFGGWYTEQALTNTYTFTTMPASDLTLYAKWTINQYTISFEVDGGSAVTDITSIAGVAITKPNDPTKEGYDFIGWYTEATLTNAYTFTTMPANNLTLYSKWEAEIYILALNTNGGSIVNDVSAPYLSDIILPTVTRVGYTFGGWFTDSELTTEFTETKMPLNGGLLYAKWDINEYKISYVAYDSTYNPTINILVPYGDKIIKISSNYVHNIAITEFGNVYVWGTNSQGELGNYSFDPVGYAENIRSNFFLDEDDKIVNVATGGRFTIALSMKGRLFSFGSNLSGQLGIEDVQRTNIPIEITDKILLRKIDQGEFIVDILAMVDSVAILTSEGSVFTWGGNYYGELADGTTNDSRYLPLEVTGWYDLNLNEKIVNIFSTSRALFAITSEGRVFSNGYNNDGELGTGTFVSSSLPIDITANLNLNDTETILGMAGGASHAGVYTSEGRLLIWGGNYSGQLGTGNKDRKSLPYDITTNIALNTGEFIVNMEFGLHFSAIITSEGRIITWGANEYGQLGNGNNLEQLSPVDITSNFDLGINDSIIFLSFGWVHSTAISEKGYVFTWGNNDHLQLGSEYSENISIPDKTPNFYYYQEYDVDFVEYLSPINLITITDQAYSLVGWYVDSILMEPFVLETMPTHDLIVFAKWNDPYTTIYLKHNGGYGIEAVYEIPGNEIYHQGSYREGYSLYGWYVDPELTIQYTFNLMPSEDLILYAKWQIGTYNVTYLDIDNNTLFSEYFEYGESLEDIIIPDAPIREGYTFIKWDIELPDIMPGTGLIIRPIYEIN